MPISFKDILFIDPMFLEYLTKTICQLGYQYEFIDKDNIKAFKLNQLNNFSTHIIWDKQTERISFIGKLDQKIYNNNLIYRVNGVNSILIEGKFIILKGYLGFFLNIDLKDIVISFTALKRWINLPYSTFIIYKDQLNDLIEGK